MPSERTWRLIVDAAADAAHNMAIDEALLEAHDRRGESAPPTLRLYGWSSPALSLGRTQASPAPGEIDRLRAGGIEVVRRPTGGDAVLHDQERTYAVIGGLGSADFPRGVTETYARIARALAAGMARLGIAASSAVPQRAGSRSALCFERLSGSELAVAGKKLVGSAQARRRRSFLQHGSIPIRWDRARLAEAAGRPIDDAAFTDLATVAGRELSLAEIDAALQEGFTSEFRIVLRTGPVDREIALRAAELRAWRYDSLAWTRDGSIGERERRWGPPLPA